MEVDAKRWVISNIAGMQWKGENREKMAKKMDEGKKRGGTLKREKKSSKRKRERRERRWQIYIYLFFFWKEEREEGK